MTIYMKVFLSSYTYLKKGDKVRKEHECGCVTEDRGEGEIHFLKMCEHHRLYGFVYVALKHNR